MLSLQDPRWAELDHAYGPAIDIPGLLTQLAKSPGQSGPDGEPFFSLWSSLCHQGDIYSASYAATPHLVGMAIEIISPIDFNFFLLPASIEVARLAGGGPDLPAWLAADYQQAIARLPEAVQAHSAEPWDQDMLLSAVAALAIAKGHRDVAEALLNLDAQWIEKINADDWD